MATVNIKFFKPALLQGAAALMSTNSSTIDETLTSSPVSQSTTNSATGTNYARVVASGGNVWLKFGTNPTAVTGTGHLLIEGIPEFFYVENGFKVAVVD